MACRQIVHQFSAQYGQQAVVHQFCAQRLQEVVQQFPALDGMQVVVHYFWAKTGLQATYGILFSALDGLLVIHTSYPP